MGCDKEKLDRIDRMFQDSQDSSCSSDIVGARIEFESSEIAGGLAFNRVFLSSGDFGVELAGRL